MFYDSFANREKNNLGKTLVKKLFEKLAKTAAENSPVKILEIGVGKGLFFDAMKKEIPQMEYIGIEANGTLSAKARDMGINVIQTFIPPFPPELEKGSFDLVVMSHVIEHFLDYREILKVLNDINSLLKPGGRLLLFYPCVRDYGLDFFDLDYTHSYITTANRINELLWDTNYQVIKQDSYRSCFNTFRAFFFCLSKVINCLKFLNLKARKTFNKNVLTIAQKK